MASGGRVDLDGGAVTPLTICMIGTGVFIGSHLCEKLMAETPHVVLAVDVYSDKIRHLVDPPPPHLAGRISFHRLNIKNDPRLEGLVKMADLVLPLPPSPRGSSSGAAAPAPTGQQPGDPRKSDQKTDPKPAGTSPEPIQEPRVEEARDCGGFAFLCALAGHKEAITGISMPMGSNKLYSGSADGSIRVWDGKSGKCVDVIKMGGKIGCMITHDKWVFVGIPKSVEAWNINTGMKLSLQGPSGLVCSMTIKDGMLFAGTADGRIMAWKFPAKDINSEPVAILAGHDRHVISLAVSATRLYSGSLDKTIRVWDLKNLQCVQTLSEHKAAVTSVLCWGQKLLSCSLDKTVKAWAASESGDLQLMHTHSEEHGVRTLFGMHRPGKTPVLLCSLHKRSCVRLLDLPSFEEMGTLSSKTEVKTIELAQGPSWLLFTGDGAGELKVWTWASQDEELAPNTGAAINVC